MKNHLRACFRVGPLAIVLAFAVAAGQAAEPSGPSARHVRSHHQIVVSNALSFDSGPGIPR